MGSVCSVGEGEGKGDKELTDSIPAASNRDWLAGYYRISRSACTKVREFRHHCFVAGVVS